MQHRVSTSTGLRPMAMETRCCKVLFPNYSKTFRLKIRSYRRYGKNREGRFLFFILFVHTAARGGTCTFRIVRTLLQTAHVTIDLRSRHRINPRPTRFVRARPMNVDDDLEDIRWIRVLGGERLPAAPHALLPNLKKDIYFLPSARN